MLVWMDLEMTGLDPDRHVIVEIATLITDDDLEIVAEGPDLVVHQPPQALEGMEPVVVEDTKLGILIGKLVAASGAALSELVTEDMAAELATRGAPRRGILPNSCSRRPGCTSRTARSP